MTVNDRVRKHRAKLHDAYCSRLEVWIGTTVIENVRVIAKHQRVPIWEAVQDALEAYVSGHAAADNGLKNP